MATGRQENKGNKGKGAGKAHSPKNRSARLENYSWKGTMNNLAECRLKWNGIHSRRQ